MDLCGTARRLGTGTLGLEARLIRAYSPQPGRFTSQCGAINLVSVSVLNDTGRMDFPPALNLVDTDPVVAELLARAWTALADNSGTSADAQGERGGRYRDEQQQRPWDRRPGDDRNM